MSSKRVRNELSVLRLSTWAAGLAVGLLVLIQSLSVLRPMSLETSKVVSHESSDTQAVLGYSNYYLRINDGTQEWGSHDVISQMLSDAPAFGVAGKAFNSEGVVRIYKADMSNLLAFMAYNEDGERLNQQSTDGLEKLTEYPVILNSELETYELPTAEAGIYLIDVSAGTMREFAYVVRSENGALVKEGDNLFVFWVQSFANYQRVPQASVAVYQLEGGVNLLYTAETGGDGIATTPLTGTADVAVVTVNGEQSLIPINLRYSGYNNYSMFAPDGNLYRMFSFTDRPLYRPGDTVYFKSIVRRDNDAQYTIPNGMAEVRLQKAYDDESPIISRSIPVVEGSVDSEFELPDDLALGDYSIVLTMPDGSNQNMWFWDNSSGATSRTPFQVEEYRKPEYSLDLLATQRVFTAGDTIKMTGMAEYFSGQPVTEGTVSLRVFTTDYYDYGYYDPEHHLSDDYRYGHWWGREVESRSLALDESGHVDISLPTSVTQSLARPQVYTFETEYVDGSGNPVFARKNVLVWPAKYAVYQGTGWRYWHADAVGKELELPYLVVNQQGDPVPGVSLTFDVSHQKWVKTEDDSGWRYTSKERKLAEMSAVTGDDGVARLRFVPDESGRFDFVARGHDAGGNVFGKEFSISVADSDSDSGWWYSGNGQNSLRLVSDKEQYTPDETAIFSLISDIPNRDVLLSMDREHMRRYQVVRMEGTEQQVEIDLEQTDMPNIYATVLGFGRDDLLRDTLSLNVSAEQQRISVQVEADQAKYGPGDTVTLDITTVDDAGKPVSAETTVWTVDKALFELGNEQLGDIFKRFWDSRYNQTEMAHSLQGIYDYGAEMGGCFVGDTLVSMADGSYQPIADVSVGDQVLTRASAEDSQLVAATVTAVHTHMADGYMILNGYLRVTPEHRLWVNGDWQEAGAVQVGDYLVLENGHEEEVLSVEWQRQTVEVYNLTIADYQTYMADGVWVHNEKGGVDRTVFKDTAYWNPRVRTNANGQARVTFQLPDNLTTWVVSAVAANDLTQVGQARTEVVVSKDIIVRPLLPNILRVGDSAVLQAVVHNYTDADLEMQVWVEHDGLEIENQTQNGVSVVAGQSQTISWPVVASEVMTDGELRVGAERGEQGDSLAVPLPVYAAGVSERFAASGAGGQMYSWDVAEDTEWSQSKARLNLSSSLVGSVIPTLEYLIDYPYGCVEQTTSRFVPVVLAVGRESLFGDVLDNKDLDAMVEKGLSRLAAQQKDDGSWGWWYGESDMWLTVYVLDSLQMAKSKGFEVDAEMMQSGVAYIDTRSKDLTFNRTANAETKAMIAYANAVIRPDEPFEMTPVAESLESDLLALAVIANLTHGYDDATVNGVDMLRSRAQTTESGVYWHAADSRRFGSIDATTALAARALLLANPNDDLVSDALRYLSTSRKYDYWSSTFASVQVLRLMLDYGENADEFDPDFQYTVLAGGQQVASGRVTDQWQKEIDLAAYADSGAVEIQVEGEGRLYSTVVVDQWRTSRELSATNNGLQIDRIIENTTKPGMSLAPGDIAKISLQVANLTGVDQQYLMVDDQIPAGLVPVNTGLNNESAQAKKGYRSRYGYWWSPSSLEFYQERVHSYTYRLMADRPVRIEYLARAVSTGDYAWPPAHAELMYLPENTGRTGYGQVSVMTERVPVEVQQLPQIENQGKAALADELDDSAWWKFNYMQWPWWVRVGVILGVLGVGLLGYEVWNRIAAYRSKASH